MYVRINEGARARILFSIDGFASQLEICLPIIYPYR